MNPKGLKGITGTQRSSKWLIKAHWRFKDLTGDHLKKAVIGVQKKYGVQIKKCQKVSLRLKRAEAHFKKISPDFGVQEKSSYTPQLV